MAESSIRDQVVAPVCRDCQRIASDGLNGQHNHRQRLHLTLGDLNAAPFETRAQAGTAA